MTLPMFCKGYYNIITRPFGPSGVSSGGAFLSKRHPMFAKVKIAECVKLVIY
jgi:hypothetical protein